MDYKPLYDVRMVEKNGKHLYSVNGQDTSYPGSTTVLSVIAKPYLIPWASKMTAIYTRSIIEKILHKNQDKPIGEIFTPRFLETLANRSKKQHKIHKERAGDIGTRTHAALDSLIRGEMPMMEEDIRQCVTSFVDWDTIKKLQIVSGDMKLIHLGFGYGGSLDALAKDERGKLIVIDFKTSNQISDEYAYQIASYCHALQFTLALDYVPEGCCIRFDKLKPEIEYRKVRSIADSFEGFLAALQLYKNQKLIPFEDRKIFNAKKEKQNDTRTRQIRKSTNGEISSRANR